MKALELIAPSELAVVEKSLPVAGEGEVLLEVKACGICGSDVHGMDGSSGRRIPPVVMGHEASGVIAGLGKGVACWQVGERVTFDSTVFCGECHFCCRGEVNLCESRQVMGVSCAEFHRDGAFAEFVVIPAHILHRLPEGLSFEEAAFAEPVGVALHAVSRVKPEGGETAVVVGAGLIGLLVVQALKKAGCGRVFAVDLDRERLRLAEELGAEAGWHALEDEVEGRLAEATAGRGADIVMEVVGATPTVRQAVNLTRKGGKIGLVGNLAPEVDFPLQAVVTRELSVFGSCAIAGEYPEALEAISSGEIRVRPLISASAPLGEGAAWFEKAKRGETLKVLLRPE
ncbi:MAG: zinc-dependent alcohol dehydrogenase [Verrucomicrobiales bacterium]